MAVLNKLLMVSITEELLAKMDELLPEEDKKLARNQFILEAIDYYLQQKNRERMRKYLEDGYREMAEINLRICQEYFLCEQEVMK